MHRDSIDSNGEAAVGRTIAPGGCVAAPPTTQLADGGRVPTPPHDSRVAALASSDMRAFVGTPGPFLKPMQCFIVREKATGGLLSKATHVYKLYLESGDAFVLAAQRRARTKAPSYIVSLDSAGVEREGPMYYGKIKSNFIGTEFQAFDAGERDPRRQPRAGPALASTGNNSPLPDGAAGAPAGRSELAVVQYHMNVMGTKGPRKMTIGVPHVDLDTNEAAAWRQDSMLGRLKSESSDGMIKLVNKVPKWNSSLGAYCLNFNGRVTQASVKNFQLVSEGDVNDRDVLQFGRVSSNRFTMDFCWPLTAFQAFCICVTSLDSKLACE